MVSILLDTNAVSAFFDKEPAVTSRIELMPEVFLPTIVVGEFAFGSLNSADPEDNLAKLDDFIRGCEIVECDLAVSREYARIRYSLKRAGMPIPENDIWIAACALTRDLPLLSKDEHFERVVGLTRIGW